MISSAVPATHTVRLGGTAEVNTYESPATAITAPGGAEKTALPNALKEAATYEQRAYQQRRHRHRAHILDVGQEGQGPSRARQGREEVTTPATGPVDLAAVERDIAAVLVAHGLTDHDTVQVAAYPIEQAGHTAGVTVTAYAYTPPAGVPAQRPASGSPFTALAARLEVAS